MANLEIGELYKKADFGITCFILATHFIDGEWYVFVNLGGEFHNRIADNGILIELRKNNNWDNRFNENHHIFVRKDKSNPYFTYIGLSKTQERKNIIIESKTEKVKVFCTCKMDQKILEKYKEFHYIERLIL